jgi:hypothetical protein
MPTVMGSNRFLFGIEVRKAEQVRNRTWLVSTLSVFLKKNVNWEANRV